MIWFVQVNKQLQQAGDEHYFVRWLRRHSTLQSNAELRRIVGLAQFYHKVSHIESLSTTTLLFVVTYSSYLIYGNTVWTIQEINTHNFICRVLLSKKLFLFYLYCYVQHQSQVQTTKFKKGELRIWPTRNAKNKTENVKNFWILKLRLKT